MEQNADSRIIRPAYIYAGLTRYFILCILYGNNNHLIFLLRIQHDQIFKCSSLPGSGMALEASQVNPKVKAYLTPDITGLT